MHYLNTDEKVIVAALLYTAKDHQVQISHLLSSGKSTMSISEFEADLAKLRTPYTSKTFKSEYLDMLVESRLDTFNPLKYLGRHDKEVQVEKYLFMVEINIRVLQDLDLQAIKGLAVS